MWSLNRIIDETQEINNGSVLELTSVLQQMQLYEFQKLISSPSGCVGVEIPHPLCEGQKKKLAELFQLEASGWQALVANFLKLTSEAITVCLNFILK